MPPAETLNNLKPGQLVQVDSPFDLGGEPLELFVSKVSDSGVVTLRMHWHGIFMRELAGKAKPDGGVLWSAQ